MERKQKREKRQDEKLVSTWEAGRGGRAESLGSQTSVASHLEPEGSPSPHSHL